LGCLTVLSGLGRDQYFYGYGHVICSLRLLGRQRKVL
jgi:hypothetical protein